MKAADEFERDVMTLCRGEALPDEAGMLALGLIKDRRDLVDLLRECLDAWEYKAIPDDLTRRVKIALRRE